MDTQNKFFVFDENVRRYQCTRENTPFRNYIGQDGAVERLLDLMYQGYGNEYHLIQENVMLTGPPSTGKTTIVKMFAESVMTPAVLTDSNQIAGGVTVGDVSVPPGAETVIHLMLDAWARTAFGPLKGVRAGSFSSYVAPPMVVFIDEIHGLSRKSADALLKATERADGMLLGRKTVMDCRNVLWFGATTDWGKLPPAFRTRFMRIDLVPPTFDEVVKIVKINNPGMSDGVCRKVVFFGSLVPREALAFARTVERYAQRMGVLTSDAIFECAQREGIDKWGMRRQRVDILKALKAGGLNLRNLRASVACEAEEILSYWLPPLLFSKPPLVVFDRSQYSLTEAGKEELAKRGF